MIAFFLTKSLNVTPLGLLAGPDTGSNSSGSVRPAFTTSVCAPVSSTNLPATSAAASSPFTTATVSTGFLTLARADTLFSVVPSSPANSLAPLVTKDFRGDDTALVDPSVAMSTTPKIAHRFAIGSSPRYVASLAALYRFQILSSEKIPSFLRSAMYSLAQSLNSLGSRVLKALLISLPSRLDL